LKYQTRCVAAFPDQNGFALGSIEGRVAIEMVNSQSPSEKYVSLREALTFWIIS
jgi:mRNA export factor